MNNLSLKHVDFNKLRDLAAEKFGLTLGRYQTSDDPSLLELWQLTHPGGGRRQEYFNWLYKDNPAGRALIRLGKIGQDVVGQFVVIPFRAKIGDKMLNGGLSINTLTHPDFRGIGVYPLAANLAFNDCPGSGIQYLLGLPNQNAYLSSLKAGFGLIGDLDVLVKLNKFSGLAAARSKIAGFLRPLMDILTGMYFAGLPYKRNRRIEIGSAEKIDDRFDQLWERSKDRFTNLQVRDRCFLNWRYNNPNQEYKIFTAKSRGQLKGYIVICEVNKDQGRQGVVVDILADDGPIYLELIKYAADYFKTSNLNLVITLASPDGRTVGFFKRFGFRKCPARFRSNSLPIVSRICSKHVQPAEINDLRRWYLTFGDFDLF